MKKAGIFVAIFTPTACSVLKKVMCGHSTTGVVIDLRACLLDCCVDF